VHVVGAVIFDLDGVLIDSEPVWERVRRAYVAAAGGRWRPDSQARMMGMSTAEWSAYVSGDLGVGRPPETVAREVIDRMAEEYADGVPLLPGAVATVEGVAERFTLGLASSSPRRLVDEVIATAGLSGAFAAVRSTEQESRGKPAPDVYLSVSHEIGVDPPECVAVEDSTNGLRAAASAGMIVVAAPRPEYPPDPDALALAAAVISRLDELPAVMDKLAAVHR
jgi:HAD superfamily hydrolase (TIGR01509 family)